MVKIVSSNFSKHSLKYIFLIILGFFILQASSSYAFFSDKEIEFLQKEFSQKLLNERIALWAEKFIGTPYDTDPLGQYVTKKVIVSDDSVDCMYLVFRVLELALSQTPQQAVETAMEKRFTTIGVLDKYGKVANYEERYAYGEDMIDSGKWGKEITENIGRTIGIKGSRGRDRVKIVLKKELMEKLDKFPDTKSLKDGDIIFFVKAIEKRISDEIVGHMGIIKKEKDGIYLIHANGIKNKNGSVKKVRLYDYLKTTSFIGLRISRFE
ncbi:MAG: DUF1460 domain-containing protein [Nitrospiraceae bacterium]|nr:DUF1460 domain-containing protein [Nitrospiraceae bacterium]